MPAVRSDPKYESIAQGAAVVDDYVLQEFLTDFIDNASPQERIAAYKTLEARASQ